MNLECSALFFVYTGANFSSHPLFLRSDWKLHPNLLTPYSTISATVVPGDMPARNVYTPSESEPKCPETLVNKQKMTSQALRDQEAAGSNPVTPMLQKPLKSLRFRGFSLFSVLETCAVFPHELSQLGQSGGKIPFILLFHYSNWLADILVDRHFHTGICPTRFS